MGNKLVIEGRMAAAVRATARLLDVSPLDALYVSAVYLGSSMIRSMEEEGRDLAEIREEMRTLMECFESCEIEGVGLVGELDELCADSLTGSGGLRH